MLRAVYGFMAAFGQSQTAACTAVAQLHGRSISRVQTLFSDFDNNRVIKWRNPSSRERGSLNYAVAAAALDDAAWEEVFDEMDRINSNGGQVTARLVQQHLIDVRSVKLSLWQVRAQLRLRDCHYARSFSVAPVDAVWHAKRIARFIRQYVQALIKESEGTHICVWMDESYIHNNHAVERGWFRPGSKRHVVISKRTGRLVIFHAITRDGLLCNEHSRDSDMDRDLTVETLNAEYVYHIDPKKVNISAASAAASAAAAAATASEDVQETPGTVKDRKDDKEDYHGNIDGTMFIQWLRHRLIPAFKARYPCMKMILIMDNASYHNPHDDGWIPVGKMRKEQVAATLEAAGVEQFTAERQVQAKQSERQAQQAAASSPSSSHSSSSASSPSSSHSSSSSSSSSPHHAQQQEVTETETVTFSRENWRQRAGTKGAAGPVPTAEELRNELRRHYRQHPEKEMTVTRRLFAELGWSIIFTPPLEPRCQPIERL